MNEMIERVARALQIVTNPLDPYDQIGEEGQLIHQKRARAAIAVMREPTGEMMEKADFSLSKRLGFVMVPEAKRIWQIMIDEVLRDNEPPS